MKIFVLLLTLIVFSACKTNQKENELKLLIQSELDQVIKEQGYPGASLSLVMPDGKLYAFASGWADMENKIAMKPDHRLFSGSVGKTYVIAVVIQLIEENKLHFTDSLSQYFGKEPWFDSLPNSHDITVEMLLSHTTGISRYEYNPKVWKILEKNPEKSFTPLERLRFAFEMPVVHASGKGWSYSDTNYILLGMIIEKITGHFYYDELKTRILIPLKLESTFPAVQRNLPGLASGYSTLGEPFNMKGKVTVDGLYIFNPQTEWTGGGLFLTSADLAKWAKMLYEGKAFSSEMVEKIATPVIFHTDLLSHAKYGMGTMIWESDSVISYGHTGFVPGYRAIMEYLPEYKFSLAMQVNTDTTSKLTLHECMVRFEKIVIQNLDK